MGAQSTNRTLSKDSGKSVSYLASLRVLGVQSLFSELQAARPKCWI